MRRIRERVQEITLPLLVLHGTDDHLTNPRGSERLFKLADSKDKELKLYEGFYHEILNETERGACARRHHPLARRTFLGGATLYTGPPSAGPFREPVPRLPRPTLAQRSTRSSCSAGVSARRTSSTVT